MAEQPGGSEEQSLEMRVAALEDKLASVQVTEQDWEGFRKVSQLMPASVPASESALPLCIRCVTCASCVRCVRCSSCIRCSRCSCLPTCSPCIAAAEAVDEFGFLGF